MKIPDDLAARYLLCAALVLCFSLGVAYSEDNPQALNKLNVVALDGHGQPVTDLTRDDFRVYDGGKPQPITWFRFTGGKSGLATLAPREHYNRSSTPDDIVVILFDMLNDPLLADVPISSEIIDALKNHESGERIYLYLLTPRGDLFPVHPLPPPNTDLQAEAVPWTRNLGPTLDKDLKTFVGLRPRADFDIKFLYDHTVDALQNLGGNMAEISGRKNLVWVTHGFPIYGYSVSARSALDFRNALNGFYQRFRLSQIAIYPVDQSIRGAAAAVSTYTTEMLQTTADLTGGRRLTSDRVNEAVTDALTDSRANYEIAYQTQAQKADGKRHKIRVTTARKDVRLETIQEYYVLPPTAPDKLEQAGFDTAIRSPFDATEIGVRASIAPASNSKSFNVTIVLDRDDLLLLDSGQNFTGKFEVMVATYDSSGFQVASKPITFDLNLTPDQFEAAARDGLTIQKNLVIPDSIQRIRAIVYDPALNATGSITVPMAP